MIVTIYCSGSIQKGTADSRKICWTDVERQQLAEAARPLDVEFLNPDDPVQGLDDALAMFGRDMHQVQFADYVVVDGRERRGIGIGIEMVASRLLGTPLIAVVPRNSYYRMDKVSYRGSDVADYVHPHLEILADRIVDDFVAAGELIRSCASAPLKAKGVEAIQAAIAAYKARILPADAPMLATLERVARVRGGK